MGVEVGHEDQERESGFASQDCHQQNGWTKTEGKERH